jgi:hypothetical protein
VPHAPGRLAVRVDRHVPSSSAFDGAVLPGSLSCDQIRDRRV